MSRGEQILVSSALEVLVSSGESEFKEALNGRMTLRSPSTLGRNQHRISVFTVCSDPSSISITPTGAEGFNLPNLPLGQIRQVELAPVYRRLARLRAYHGANRATYRLVGCGR